MPPLDIPTKTSRKGVTDGHGRSSGSWPWQKYSPKHLFGPCNSSKNHKNHTKLVLAKHILWLTYKHVKPFTLVKFSWFKRLNKFLKDTNLIWSGLDSWVWTLLGAVKVLHNLFWFYLRLPLPPWNHCNNLGDPTPSWSCYLVIPYSLKCNMESRDQINVWRK